MDLTPWMERWHMLPQQGGIVLCGVSGGRDSVCLLDYLHTLGQERGFTAAAGHLNHLMRPTAQRDEDFVRAFCAQRDIPFYTESADVYGLCDTWELTVEETGRRARYDFLRRTAAAIGAEKIATGHYARVWFNEALQRHELLKGLDPAKDQSYFLHRLTQAQLGKTLFPVGELHKTEVRRIAAEIGLPNAKKKDSTGICFIGERPFREFLNRYISHAPGPILDDRGRKLGQHVGLSFYTLGQRQGLGIGGVKEKGAQRGGGSHEPWFVARKDLEKNTLRVVQGHDHPWLLSHRLVAQDLSWCAGHAPAPGAYAAKTRYRQQDAACTLETSPDGMALQFPEAQWAVTPGQSAVLYDGEVCLGGGVIAAVDTPL